MTDGAIPGAEGIGVGGLPVRLGPLVLPTRPPRQFGYCVRRTTRTQRRPHVQTLLLLMLLLLLLLATTTTTTTTQRRPHVQGEWVMN